MQLHPIRVMLAGAMLGAAGLACSLGLDGPTPPASPIAVSTEAAGQLEDLLTQASGSAGDGEVTVVVTEEQLTSYFALKLAEDPDSPLKDIQIFLRDGYIVVHGKATVQNITAPAEIRMTAATTPEGDLDVNVANADFGPMPVPESMLDSLSNALDEALAGRFGSAATGIRISSVVVGDGQMTITGTASR